MVKKRIQKEFIQECINQYGDKYDYKLVKYINNTTKIDIICNNCKIIFKKTPKHHLYRKQGCKKCKIIKRDNTKRYNNFVTRAKQIHKDKFNYSSINAENYNCIKVKIFCNRCKIFFMQRPSSHLSGCGHIKCCLWLSNKDFIDRVKKLHKNRYSYEKVNYKNNRTKIEIWCKKHKYYFLQMAQHHLKNHGCPKCKSSKGELKIIDYLDEKNIKYKFQKIHKFMGTILKFDFYIPDKKLYIEYDGNQHFIESDYFEDTLTIVRNRDILKNAYVCHQNLKLLRISYKNFNNITKLLDIYLQKKLTNNIFYSNDHYYN